MFLSLTVTSSSPPATDVGFVLHKHPGHARRQDLAFGTAHVLWPEATPERAQMAVVVEVDPIALVRGHAGSSQDGPLAQYVNDRPYAASSMLSVASTR